MSAPQEYKKRYDISHTNPMGWDEFHHIVETVIARLRASGVVFDAVVPLLRSGAIPAVMIANKLRIIPIIPLQLKYDYAAGMVAVKTPPVVPPGLDAAAPLNLLVVECNTNTGQSATQAQKLLAATFPAATLHYATVTAVFGGPTTLAGYAAYYIGTVANEAFKDDAPQTARAGITIFPWETAEYELDDINANA